MLSTPICLSHNLFVDVEAEGVDSEPELGAFLVFDLKVIDTVHLEVLGDLEILHHGVLAQHAAVFPIPYIGL